MAKRTIPEDKQRRAMMMETVRELGSPDANELYIALRDVFTETMEDMIKVELDEHLGYEKHDREQRRQATIATAQRQRW